MIICDFMNVSAQANNTVEVSELVVSTGRASLFSDLWAHRPGRVSWLLGSYGCGPGLRLVAIIKCIFLLSQNFRHSNSGQFIYVFIVGNTQVARSFPRSYYFHHNLRIPLRSYEVCQLKLNNLIRAWQRFSSYDGSTKLFIFLSIKTRQLLVTSCMNYKVNMDEVSLFNLTNTN